MAVTYNFRPHCTPPQNVQKIGHGHWLLYVNQPADGNPAQVLKYSCDDNDFFYELNADDGKIYLYDVKLYIDQGSGDLCNIVQLPLESFIGVSGGRTQITPSNYNNKWE
tara:strand:- start:43 stop:369 length:327 start_codon:yes stop_codon:yes gene_type:complete